MTTAPMLYPELPDQRRAQLRRRLVSIEFTDLRTDDLEAASHTTSMNSTPRTVVGA